MDKIVIDGGIRLKGNIEVSGAKNAALPILAATLLTDKKCVIKNVPNLRDVSTMLKILRSLGIRCWMSDHEVIIEPKTLKNCVASYKLVSTMRASICVLGPLLAKYKQARVSMPGGCIIGQRPVDLHIKGLKSLGAAIKIEHGYIVAAAKKLRGANIFLGGAYGSSVLATANVLMCACLAHGRTLIENAACEPEIVDLAVFLNKMGAKIKGQGTPSITVDGVKCLEGATHSVIPDRIEAGTHILASAITGGQLIVQKAKIEHLSALVDKLDQVGVKVKAYKNGDIHVKRKGKVLKPVDITTLPYPGFPTDMQAQMMSLLALGDGISVLTEKIFPDRFMHVSELNRMGADIFLEGASAIVKGVKRLSGAEVMASDLRASAALVLAGLVAKGRTEISRIYHLDRGYERIEEKLAKVGARIQRVKEI
ncbi:MAG: UDP-N-acetylglucosamine 1-carboxyvinyltransferase [Candidatus Omnitrophica bacterium]|nr:UDP-N-acetylglucosamine 1-carboxyvinyltransferase [Candidatus Omnitrophota bacterium]MBU1924514.1 UDP-N-acetylglucosamine 1-carboxyvinyltransferase [Candidatus Omnitrophota bacterium]MBU2064073.1 UDP-N-acetylglucosamine 1-carboxyvinyltransferase [Candidatus Omnitrophota bacterium]